MFASRSKIGICGVALLVHACFLLAGCVNGRNIYTPLVPDVGPKIATRHKYRVTKVMLLKDGKYGGGDLTSVDWSNYGWKYNGKYRVERDITSSVIKSQPAVFSSSGLPIEIILGESKEISNADKYLRENPLMYLVFVPYVFCSIVTVYGLPLPVWGERSRDYEIILDESEKKDLQLRIESYKVVTMSTPLALLCPIPGYKPPPNEDKRSFLSRDYGLDIQTAGDDSYDEALAYGIAVRLKELEDAGAIDAMLAQQEENRKAEEARRLAQEIEAKRLRAQAEAESAMQKLHAEFANRPPYRVIDLAREEGSDFAYAFTLELYGDASIQTFFGIQAVFANEVRTAYLMEYPNAEASALRVAVQPRLSNGRIVGRAEVLTIAPVSLSYSASARRGRLAVRFNQNQFEKAREWVRRNIETLARDKNIALVTGEIPPDAKFYLLDEELKDGNILEIEFKTE